VVAAMFDGTRDLDPQSVFRGFTFRWTAGFMVRAGVSTPRPPFGGIVGAAGAFN